MSIIKSLLITSFISLLFSYGLRNIIGFWETFACVTGLQIVIGFIYNSLKFSKQEEVKNIFEEEIAEVLSYSDTIFSCPCGDYAFTERVFVNMDNIFKCEKCGKVVRANVKIEPTLMTEAVSEAETYEALKTINKKEL